MQVRGGSRIFFRRGCTRTLPKLHLATFKSLCDHNHSDIVCFLYLRCKPAYVSYQFYKQPVHQSTGRQQGSDVFWEDVNVVLLGTLDKGGLVEYLQGPHFQVEVHDRDRKIEQKKPKPSLFGENPEDEMINNVSLVAGKRLAN